MKIKIILTLMIISITIISLICVMQNNAIPSQKSFIPSFKLDSSYLNLFKNVYAESRGSTDITQLIARAINGEARGEPYKGQVAVGAVIGNRTENAKFPKTVPGVIYQPGAFTAVSDGQINLAISSKSTVYKAARDAVNGWDPTGGCIYYYNPATATNKWIWSRPVVTTIGKHKFAK